MIPDDEDTRDFDDANESSLQPVTDLTGVGDEPSNDVEGMPSQTTTDISSMLEQDSNQEVIITFLIMLLLSGTIAQRPKLAHFFLPKCEILYTKMFHTKRVEI